MERKLREIFLDQVEAALSLEPCDESLFSLFKIISPTMKRSSLDTDHEQHFRKLKAEIHPDKHRNSNRANQLFKSLTEFYDKSLDENTSGPVRKRTKTSNYPMNFNCTEKWTYINLRPIESTRKEKSIGSQVAFQCINARGSIVHGKNTDYHYFAKNMNDQRSTKQVFEDYGGCKVLSTPDEIKAELMTRGPVVSTSFELSEAFLSSADDRKHFFEDNLKNKVHEVLITGWKQTPMGEVWMICPLVYESLGVEEECFNVAFGQYNSDRVCIAPDNTFEKWNWQQGPYFKVNVEKDPAEWYSWSSMSFSINPKDLEELTEAVGGDLIAGAIAKTEFTVQDWEKNFLSRSCFLTNVKYEKDKSNCWRISVDFV